MPFRRKTPFKRKSPFKRLTRRKMPYRMTPRKTRIQTVVNRAISKKLGGVIETKYISLEKLRYETPKQIWSNSLVASPTYVWGGVVGNKPSEWSSGLFGGSSQYTNLEGMLCPRGDGQGQRIGQSVFMKHTNIALNLSMNAQTDGSRDALPYRYRMIVFKPKQRVRTPGNPSDPTTDLFLDVQGNEFGHGQTDIEFMDIWQSLLNKRDYTIVKDSKFMLTPPSYKSDLSSGVAHNVTHSGAMSKDINIRVPYDKKTIYDNDTNLPDNLNTATGILIFAQCLGNPNENSELFSVSTQGNTVYQDA